MVKIFRMHWDGLGLFDSFLFHDIIFNSKEWLNMGNTNRILSDRASAGLTGRSLWFHGEAGKVKKKTWFLRDFFIFLHLLLFSTKSRVMIESGSSTDFFSFSAEEKWKNDYHSKEEPKIYGLKKVVEMNSFSYRTLSARWLDFLSLSRWLRR